MITLIIAESRQLVHVQRPVQVLKTIVLHIVIIEATASKVTANVQIHFHLRISTVCQSVHMRPWMWNVVRKESTLVEVSSLIDTLLCRRIELDHHRAVHLRPRHIHRRGIDVIQSCHASRCVTLC